MSNTSRDADRTEALRSELVQGIVQETGVPEAVALPFANSILAYLQRTRPGERLYIPQPARQYDVAGIESELLAGAAPRVVAHRHGTTVRQLQRLFPGGLPRPQDVA